MKTTTAFRLVPLVLALALALGAAPVAADDPPSDPIVYAHRGGADIAPENTLGAFRQAHERFGNRDVWIEMDAYLTADEQLVVIHDETLDRTTDCEGAVPDKTYNEIEDCNAAADWPDWGFEPVPLAHDVLIEGKEKGWRILFELKNIPYEQSFDPDGMRFASALVDLVDETGFPKDDIVVQAFWPPTLDAVKALDPDLGTALLTTSQLGFLATQNALYSSLRGYDVVAPDHHSPDLSRHTVAAIQALGHEVVLWTVNSVCDMERAIGWGVDGIITDSPDVLYDVLDGTEGCVTTQPY